MAVVLGGCNNAANTGDDAPPTDGGPDLDAVVDASPPLTDDPEWPNPLALPAEFDLPPYLNLLDATTVVVSWRTVAATTGTVTYGPTFALGSSAASSASANLHHVTLANLTPGSAYYYRVAIDGTSAFRDGVFVMPGRTAWRFMHAGEFHAPSEVSNVVKFTAAIRAFRPHVLVESGDMVDDGNSMSQWRSYLRTSEPWISNVLLLPSHSNHVNGTGGNANLMDLFVLPNNERWYTTRYSQIEFFNIDSTYSDNADIATTEVPWVAQQAAAAHDGTDDPTFVVASWHHPACSSQYFSRNGQRQWVQDNLVKTFTDNGGVDLILAAHDKYYERSTITGGIVHVITNIGNVSPEIPGGNHASCTPIKTSRSAQSTMFVTVEGSTLSAKILDETGADLDTFMIAK